MYVYIGCPCIYVFRHQNYASHNVCMVSLASPIIIIVSKGKLHICKSILLRLLLLFRFCHPMLVRKSKPNVLDYSVLKGLWLSVVFHYLRRISSWLRFSPVFRMTKTLWLHNISNASEYGESSTNWLCHSCDPNFFLLLHIFIGDMLLNSTCY